MTVYFFSLHSFANHFFLSTSFLFLPASLYCFFARPFSLAKASDISRFEILVMLYPKTFPFCYCTILCVWQRSIVSKCIKNSRLQEDREKEKKSMDLRYYGLVWLGLGNMKNGQHSHQTCRHPPILRCYSLCRLIYMSSCPSCVLIHLFGYFAILVEVSPRLG
jgi:hypothetical protein